jgi:hypothetical protein
MELCGLLVVIAFVRPRVSSSSTLITAVAPGKSCLLPTGGEPHKRFSGPAMTGLYCFMALTGSLSMLSRRGFVVSGIAVSGGLVLGYAGWQLDDGDAASKFAGPVSIAA